MQSNKTWQVKSRVSLRENDIISTKTWQMLKYISTNWITLASNIFSFQILMNGNGRPAILVVERHINFGEDDEVADRERSVGCGPCIFQETTLQWGPHHHIVLTTLTHSHPQASSLYKETTFVFLFSSLASSTISCLNLIKLFSLSLFKLIINGDDDEQQK